MRRAGVRYRSWFLGEYYAGGWCERAGIKYMVHDACSKDRTCLSIDALPEEETAIDRQERNSQFLNKPTQLLQDIPLHSLPVSLFPLPLTLSDLNLS